MKWKVHILQILVLGGLLGIGAGLYWWKNRPAAAPAAVGFEPAETVQVIDVSTAPWRPTASMVGTVFAIRSVTISNEIAGAVTEVHFDSGSVVEQGDPLLIFDTTTEQADLKAAEAAIKVAQANQEMASSALHLAQSNWNRMHEAESLRAVAAMEADKSRAEVDSTQANLDRMAAEIDQSRARADQIRALIQKKTILAPFKGRCGLRMVQPGQYLKEGSEIVSLQGIDPRIYLDFALPQEEAWRVSPGAVFMVTSAMLGPEPVRVLVQAMDAQVNAATRNVRVRSIIENPGEALRPGMAVEVSVPIGETKQYVVVPSVAVRRATFGDHVFVIGPSTVKGEGPDKTRASQRMVKLGPALGESIIVAEGLKPGERIASVGSFKLRDGALIAPPAAPSPAPAPAGTSAAKSSEDKP